MSDVKNWSEVAANNSESPPTGWPEGMKRSDVNNSAREMMRALIAVYRDPQWSNVYSTTGDAWLPEKSADLIVQMTPQDSQDVDISDRFLADSRFKMQDSGGPTQYGFVISAAKVGSNTLVTVVFDEAAGAVPASISVFELAVVRDVLERTAYYPTGVTRDEEPPQVPTIDDLGDQVLLNGGHLPDGGAGIDADTVDGLHASDLVTSSSAAGSNVVYNAGMAIWQRGTTIDSSTSAGRIYTNDNGNYCADRWRLLSGTGTGDKDNLVVVSHDSASAPTGQYRSMRFTTQDHTANDRFGIFQVLDAQDSAILIGSGAVSMGVDCLGNGTLAGVRFQVLGWDGAEDHADLGLDPVTDWGVVGGLLTYATNWTLLADSGTKTITTAWSRETFEAEDISAPAGMKNIGILIYADSVWSTTNTLNITGVRVENSAAAAAFSPNPYAVDLIACQRFFNLTFDYGEDPRHGAGLAGSVTGGITQATNKQGSIRWDFPTEMRADPDMTQWNPDDSSPPAGEYFYAERTDANQDIADYVEYLTKRRVVYWTDSAAPPNTVTFVHLAADAEF